MSDCFYFESYCGKEGRCLKREFTPSIEDRLVLTYCLKPERCRGYLSGYEHGIKKEAVRNKPII